MPNAVFRIMSFLMAWQHKFRDPGRQLEKSGVQEGQSVLDFGCGPGHYTVSAARTVGEKGMVYALDIHPLAIRAVEKKADKEKLANITTILSDRGTGLPDESMDLILLYDTLHMIKDRRALLTELHRVLKRNGLLSVGVTHMKVEDALALAEKDGLFSLKDRQGRLLNLERRSREAS